MSKEIVTVSLTGKTLYAAVINAAGQWWNTSGTPAFEAYNSAHWANYAIAMTEIGATGTYTADMPAAATGKHHIEVFNQIGGSPAIATDLPPIAAGDIVWDGAAEVTSTGDSFGRIGAAGAGLTAVGLDLTKAVGTSNTANTVGDCLNAARAQGFGKWTLVGTTLTLYANDGTTAVRTFTLDSATAPTSRT